MDPVSQTQASEALAVRGYSVIGWYHSHPAFDPNPSLRDIDTQAKYQVCLCVLCVCILQMIAHSPPHCFLLHKCTFKVPSKLLRF